MTEDEARKRWCPFAQSRTVSFIYKGGQHSTNWCGSGDMPLPSCIASDCMAWRRLTSMAGRPVDNAGYCGLAGKP